MQVGNTWGDYVRMLDDNTSYLGRLGLHVVDVKQLLGFEILQADGLCPARTIARSTDAAVEAQRMPMAFTRTYSDEISQRLHRAFRPWVGP